MSVPVLPGAQVDAVVDTFRDVKVEDQSLIWNTDLVETLELRNLLGNASTTMFGAEASSDTHDTTHTRVLF